MSFELDVQPILAAGCANPSCHGTPDRPLEVYATFLHREDPADVHLDEPLSDEEMRLNRLRFCAFLVDLDDAADAAVVSKPLHPDAGGTDHVGGWLYGDTEEPDYITLLRWAQDAIDDEDTP